MISFPFNYHVISTWADLSFFKRNANLLSEVYTPPIFMEYQDALTDFPDTKPDPIKALSILKSIKALEIPINVVLNNQNFKYDAAQLLDYKDLISTVTIYNREYLWLKKYFRVKNSVINLPTYAEVSRGEYDDFDVIQVHGDIIHNHDAWLKIKGTRTFGCISNFNICVPYCTLKAKHYKAASKVEHLDESLFCPAEKLSDDLRLMQRDSIPSTEYRYYADVIDLFKLEGRASDDVFLEACDIVQALNGHGVVQSEVYLKDRLGKRYEAYLKRVRNCGGNCPQCGYCQALLRASDNALDRGSEFPVIKHKQQR